LAERIDDVDHARSDEREREQAEHAPRGDVLCDEIDDGEETRRAQFADADIGIVGGERGDESEYEEAEQRVVNGRAMELRARAQSETHDPDQQPHAPSDLCSRNRMRRAEGQQEQARGERAFNKHYRHEASRAACAG
jgi:hypothetical protein